MLIQAKKKVFVIAVALASCGYRSIFVALLNWRRWNLERHPYIIIITHFILLCIHILHIEHWDRNDEKANLLLQMKLKLKRLLLLFCFFSSLLSNKIMIEACCVERNDNIRFDRFFPSKHKIWLESANVILRRQLNTITAKRTSSRRWIYIVEQRRDTHTDVRE